MFEDYFEEESKGFSFDDGNKVSGPDFGSEQNDLFNSARDAFNKGVSNAGPDYSAMDHEGARVNKEKGTFKYDTGDQSVFYV